MMSEIKNVTIKEFFEMTDKERKENYMNLSEHDSFIWRTQYEPVSGIVFDNPKTKAQTVEEKDKSKRNLKRFQELMKKLREEQSE